MRSLGSRPELSFKLLNSVPGLRDKVEQAGGIDNVLNPASLARYSLILNNLIGKSSPPGPTAAGGPGSHTDPEVPPNPSQVLSSLRGKAELDPDLVRRKLEDTFRQKEHFQYLVSLAQMASYQDPDLSTIALDVAQGILPLFENLQERANYVRSLVSTYRQLEGEVPASLLKAGLVLAGEMRRQEDSREQPVPPDVRLPHPSDDLKIMLMAQSSPEDFNAALRSARALEDDLLQIKALMQIAQTLANNY